MSRGIYRCRAPRELRSALRADHLKGLQERVVVGGIIIQYGSAGPKAIRITNYNRSSTAESGSACHTLGVGGGGRQLWINDVSED